MGPAMRRKGGRRRCVRKRVSMVMVRENSALVRFPAARAQIAMFSFLYRYLCAGPVSSDIENFACECEDVSSCESLRAYGEHVGRGPEPLAGVHLA